MTASPSDLAGGALELACEQPVLPLEPAGKKPLGGLGLLSATKDRSVVAGWWERWPDANVGCRCDGLLVVDIDGEPGEESLTRLEHRFGQLPTTRGARTGKGRHLIFASPTLVGNSTAALGRPPGVDLRGGTRGYVVAPPSLHASGRRYEWIDERPPVPLPATWREPLTAITYTSAGLATADAKTETAYGSVALTSELERLLRAQPGQRNEMLNASVFRLAQLAAGGQLPQVRVEESARMAAQMLGLDAREARVTIRSALTAGLKSPRLPRARPRAREISDFSNSRKERSLPGLSGNAGGWL